MSGPDTNTNEREYPPQLHAGKVGFGPNYHTGPTLGEKAQGYKEEIMGKIMHNHDKAQHGKDLVSGEVKRRELEADAHENPFANAKEDDSPAIAKDDKGAKEEAATIAPVGTEENERQRRHGLDSVNEDM